MADAAVLHFDFNLLIAKRAGVVGERLKLALGFICRKRVDCTHASIDVLAGSMAANVRKIPGIHRTLGGACLKFHLQ